MEIHENFCDKRWAKQQRKTKPASLPALPPIMLLDHKDSGCCSPARARKLPLEQRSCGVLPWIWFYAAVSGDKQSDCTGDCKKQLDNQSAVTFGLRRISDCIKDNWKSKLASVLQHIARVLSMVVCYSQAITIIELLLG